MEGNFNKDTFIYYKDEETSKSKLGITKNIIVEIPNFIDATTSNLVATCFEEEGESWQDIAFYKSYGKTLPSSEEAAKYGLEDSFFEVLKAKCQQAVELVYEQKLKPNTAHAQKWGVGGFAFPHSDNSDFDGNPTAFEINKYVAILYLNSDYEGGELYFPDHGIEIKPNSTSLFIFSGGIENIHGVKAITAGTRYTMVSFWDFEDAKYSDERRSEWEEEIKSVRFKQDIQRKEWNNDIFN